MSLVLIADDNPHAHRMGRQILSQEGHEVVTVSNGDEALEYLSRNRPDLVMADTRMPGPSGYEVCRHIKHSGRFPGMRVVLLAGPLEPFDAALADTVGSDAVLHKPLDAYSLIDTVNRLIGDLDTAAPPPPDVEPSEELQPPEPAPVEAYSAPVATPPTPAQAAAPGDPFEELVEQALGCVTAPSNRDAEVRGAVLEVLEASLPTLVDTITQRVVERLNGRG